MKSAEILGGGEDLGTLSQTLLRGLLKEEVTLRYWRLQSNRHP